MENSGLMRFKMLKTTVLVKIFEGINFKYYRNFQKSESLIFSSKNHWVNISQFFEISIQKVLFS